MKDFQPQGEASILEEKISWEKIQRLKYLLVFNF
jgi:hypothetical protein